MSDRQPLETAKSQREGRLDRRLLHRVIPWILAGFIVFQLAIAVAWMRFDATPPYWDEAWYLYQGAVQHDALRSRDLHAWADAWLRLDPTRPSLVPALTVPFYAAFGISGDAGLLVNLVAWAILLLATYALGTAIGGPRSGILSTLVIGSYPVLVGLVHILLVELVMVALVAATLYALWRSDGFVNRGWAVAAGLLSGFGALTKVFFVSFVIGPWLLTAVRSLCRRRDQQSRRRLANLLLGLGGAALIAGSWYLPNLKHALDRTIDAGVGVEGAVYGPGNPLHWASLLTYLVRFAGKGISFASFLALIVGAFGLGLTIRRSRKESDGHHRLDRYAVLFLASSAVLGYALFTSLNNQDLKHVTGILPALAVLTGWGITRLFPRRWLIAASLILTFAVFQVTAATLPGRLQSSRLRVPVLQGSLWFFYPAQPDELDTRYAAPDGTHWPLREILSYALLVADVESLPQKVARVGVLPDYPAFEAYAFRFEAYRLRMPVVVGPAALSSLPEHGVLIHKTGDWGWDPSEPAVRAVTRAIAQPGSGFERMPRTFALPDGSYAFIYGRGPSPLLENAPSPSHPHPVEFGSSARYLGFDVTPALATTETVTLTITHYWESLGPTQHDCSVFIHLLDPDTDAIIVQDDHRLFPHTYPTTLWQADRFLREQREVRIPATFAGSALKLRLGLYSEGGRLAAGQRGDPSVAVADYADVGFIQLPP